MALESARREISLVINADRRNFLDDRRAKDGGAENEGEWRILMGGGESGCCLSLWEVVCGRDRCVNG